jgi:hypothetical protein
VGLKWIGSERKVEWKIYTEEAKDGLVAPLELSDGVMEQVEAMAKELRKISGGIWALMSMPNALPMEIALIALLLFKLRVYSTSLCHYYHRPITLSMFQLFHQSTLHHMVSINTLQLPIKKFFVHKIGAPTHTQYSLTQPQLSGVQSQQLFSTSISFPKLIFTSIAHIKSHGTHLRQYFSHH